MSKKTILYSYVVVCILYFFSSLLQLNSLEVITKPLFLPILMVYYLRKAKSKYETWVIVSFVFYFVGEILVLLDKDKNYLLSVFFFLIPYLILLYLITIKLMILLKERGFKKLNYTLPFLIVFLIYLYFSLLFLIETDTITEKALLYLYGLVLVLLGVFSSTLYVLKFSAQNLFLVLTVLTCIVSDVFYIFIVKIDYNFVFKAVNLTSQLLSYYFFVNYSLIKIKNKL